MVEILRRGLLPLEKTYTITCDNCDTLFRFQRHEATVPSHHQLDSAQLMIECPVCGDDQWVAP